MSQDDLALKLAKVAEELAGERDETVTTVRTCELAVELVEACDHATITLRSRRGRLTTVAASAPVAEEYDALQHELGEGPSLETVGSFEVCRSNDVARDDRWPRWGPRASELGARSLVSVQLASGSQALGAINLYSHRINAWDEQAYDLAVLFATHAALALDAAQVITGLRTALGSRHHIGVAQGILMERHGITLHQSFGVLQRFSNDTNTRLTEVAERIIAELDNDPGQTG
jgi:hypothetical protein